MIFHLCHTYSRSRYAKRFLAGGTLWVISTNTISISLLKNLYESASVDGELFCFFGALVF